MKPAAFSTTAFVGAAAAALASFLVVEVYDLDVWWHLAIGKEILSTGAVPAVDRWTVLGSGRPYHDSHWLFQAGLSAIHRAAGWLGVQALVVVLWGLTLAALWRLARRSVGPAPAAALVFLSGLACAERFLPRPELVTYACLAWFLVWLDDDQVGTPRRLALLGTAQAAWTNAHGLFPLGPAVAGLFALGSLARRRRDPATKVRGPLLAIIVTLVATLVSPFGLSGWRYAVLLTREAGQAAHEVIGSLGEMSSPFGAAASRSPAIWAYYAILALTAAAVIRDLAARRLSTSTVLTAACAALSVTGRRNVTLLAITATPLLARHVASLTAPRWLRLPGPRLVASACLLGIAAFPLTGSYYRWMRISARFGAGVTPSFFPHGAARLLSSHVPPGGLLASNDLGGFVSFHGAPRVLPLTDGRWEVQDRVRLEEVLNSTRSAGAWSSVVTRFGLRGLLLAHASPEAQAILSDIAKSPAWRLVYLDSAASLWLPAGETTLPAVSLEPPSVLTCIRRPEDGINLAAFASKADAPRLEQAALEATLPFGVHREFLLERLGLSRLAAGDYDGAEAAFEDLLRLRPRNETALNELAFLAWRRGDSSRALGLLRRLVEAAPGNPSYNENLKRVEDSSRMGSSSRRPVESNRR